VDEVEYAHAQPAPGASTARQKMIGENHRGYQRSALRQPDFKAHTLLTRFHLPDLRTLTW
jgi:hypothetical protein